MALLEKLSGSCQEEKINVWPGSPGNWDQPPSTQPMQTHSHILRPLPVLLFSSHDMCTSFMYMHSSDRDVREITLLVFWVQVKSEVIFLLTVPLLYSLMLSKAEEWSFQQSHSDLSSSVFIYVICSRNLSFLHRSNHSFALPLFFNEDPCCHQTLRWSCWYLWQEGLFPLLPVCFLSFYLPTLPSVSFSTHPSLWTLPFFLDTSELMNVTHGVHCVALCLPRFIFLPSVILTVSHHLAFLKLIYCLPYLVLSEWTWRIQLDFLLNLCPFLRTSCWHPY